MSRYFWMNLWQNMSFLSVFSAVAIIVEMNQGHNFLSMKVEKKVVWIKEKFMLQLYKYIGNIYCLCRNIRYLLISAIYAVILYREYKYQRKPAI